MVMSADFENSVVLWSFTGIVFTGVDTDRLTSCVAVNGVTTPSYTLSDGGTVNKAPD